MRQARWIIAAILLACGAAAWAGPLVVEVAYVGHGNYAFKKKVYTYADLVQTIQAKYQGEHIDLVSVYMPAGVTQGDRKDVCRLRGDLGTQLKMHLDIGNGETREQFCN